MTFAPDRNGAGIRAEGAGLTIRRCAFHDNEMGILTNNNPTSLRMIFDAEFHHNNALIGQVLPLVGPGTVQ